MIILRFLALSFLYILFNILVTVFALEDFYKILNVPKNAKLNDVKRAYRNLAKTLHPDKNKNDPQANEKFRELNKAYEVLSDPEKRRRFDAGEDPMKDASSFFHQPDDIFSSFFGDFFHHGEKPSQRENKGANVVIDLYCTLEEIYNGNFVEIHRVKPVFKTTSGTRKCNCRAEMVTRQLGPGRFQMNQVEVCDDCPNVKIVNEEKLLEVEIERGVDDKHEYPYYGEGEPHIEGEPGDLVFKIKESKHKYFERRGNDLYCNLTISLLDSLMGFRSEIKHLDGHKVTIKREAITRPDTKIRIPNEGMPHFDNNNVLGDLYVTFDIEYPNKISFSDKEKEEIKTMFYSSHQKPILYNGLQGY